MLEELKANGYEIVFESHAVAILDRDFPSALGEIETVLKDFEIPITEIIGSGGGETKGTQRLRRAFAAQGWRKTNFEIRKSIRFGDRDLENFKRLHAEGAINIEARLLASSSIDASLSSRAG